MSSNFKKLGAIFLIGPRGSGKTTVGQKLAQKTGLPFLDLDQELTKKLGTSIAEFVKLKGWEAFRRHEKTLLFELGDTFLRKEGAIVATGGGIVLDEANCQLMKACGQVIYLKVEPKVLFLRLSIDPQMAQRPALTTLDKESEIKQVLAEREKLYLGCADMVVQASAPVQEVVSKIIKQI